MSCANSYCSEVQKYIKEKTSTKNTENTATKKVCYFSFSFTLGLAQVYKKYILKQLLSKHCFILSRVFFSV